MKPKFWMMVAALTIITTLAAQCAAPATPEKVVETVVVEKEVEKVVVVTKEVEKVVTKEVEKVVTPTPQPVSKRLVVAVPDDPEGLDPWETGVFGWEFGYNIYSRLITHKVDPENHTYNKDVLVPQLAESWEVAPDNKSITFHLNPNATFSDGSPVTAEDVHYSIKRGLEGGFGFVKEQVEIGGIKSIDQIEVIDDHTVRITYPDGMNRFSLLNLVPVDASIFSRNYIQSHATSTDPYAHEYLSEHPMGSGAYTLESYMPGESLVLRARPDYWTDPRPYYDEIQYRIVPDSATRLLLIKSGQVDIAYNLSPQELKQIEGDPNMQVISVPSAQNVLVFRMNSNAPPFDDLKIRQAIIKAIPYEAIIDNSVLGYGTRVKSVCGTTAYGYKEFPLFETDLEEAKRLVAESKYPDGASFTMVVSTRYPDRMAAAVLIQANLKEIGINVDIQGLPHAAFYDKAVARELSTDMATMEPYFNDCLYWVYWMFHSESMTNHTNLDSQTVDRDTEASLHLAPEDIAIYDRLLKEVVDDTLVKEAVVAPLYQVDWTVAAGKGISNIIYWPWLSIEYAYLRPVSK